MTSYALSVHGDTSGWRIVLTLIVLIGAATCGYLLASRRGAPDPPPRPAAPPVPLPARADAPAPAAAPVPPPVPAPAAPTPAAPKPALLRRAVAPKSAAAPAAPPPPDPPSRSATGQVPVTPRPTPPKPIRQVLRTVPRPDSAASTVVDPTRRKLILALIGAHDTTSEEGVRAHVEQSLRAVGVTPQSPRPRSAFDPHTQKCVDRAIAPSSADVGLVAHTVRPGWRGADGDLRLAEVAVWEAGA